MGFNMPTLPLFSMPLLASPVTTPKPVNNIPTTESPDSINSVMSNIQTNEMGGINDIHADLDNTTSFMQSLMAAFTLPQGKGFAALDESASTELMEMNEAILETNILVDTNALSQSEYVDPVFSPWQLNQPALEVDAGLNLNLEQINLQRNANPGILQQAGIVDAASQGRAVNGALSDAVQQAGLQESILQPINAQPTPQSMAFSHQMGLAQNNPMQGTLSNGENLSAGLATPTDGLDVLQDDINIHEKPITLTANKADYSSALLVEETASVDVDGLNTQESSINLGLINDKKLKHAPDIEPSKFENEVTSKNFKLDVPPNDPKWTEQVAKRISIMSSEQLQTARIQLDPPELGSLDVKIRIQHDQMSVAFSSNQPQVREALESQAPRLREMLEQQGMNLVDVNVSSQQQGGGSNTSGSEQTAEGFQSDETDAEVPQVVTLESDSLVDFFA